MKNEQRSTTLGLPQINYYASKSEKYINQLNPRVKNNVEMLRCNISNKTKGFTLVELIITITILIILGSIVFTSYQNFTKDARDGVRLTDIKKIYDGISMYRAQTEKTLLPDNHIEITSGTGILTYQGYVGEKVKNGIKLTRGGQDPLTGDNYIYTTDKNTKKAQIMGYLETSDKEIKYIGYNLIPQAKATTNTGYYQDKKIYAYGDKIGILTDKNNIPLQETISGTGYDIILSNTGTITYFGGEVYENGTSTQSGQTLVNQIISAISNTLPCNGENYNGYTIQSLLHNESGTFTKPIGGISNGTKTGSLLITCKNGILDHINQTETFNLTCNTNYVNNNDNSNCIPDVCGLSIPTNGISTATGQTVSQNWTYNLTPGICTFQCKPNYTYNAGSNTCDADTRTNQACTGLPLSNATWNTTNSISQTWDGTSWLPTTSGTYNTTSSTSECRFTCNANYTYNSGTNTCDLNTYTVSGSFGANANGATINVCGVNVTADTSGNFTTTRNHGSICNTITATRSGYTCSTSTNGPASLTDNVTNIAGSCTPNNCTASTQTINGHTYNVPGFNHGTTTTQTSVIGITNGTRTYSQTFSCSLGVVSVSGGESNTANTCNTNYTWNSGSSTCNANTQTANCGGSIIANASASTSSQYTQTWNGSSWSPSYSWTYLAGTCGFTCNSGFNWDGSSCAQPGSSQSAAGTSCYTIKQGNASSTSGVYWIDPNGGGTSDAFQVYCDMTTNGGGRTVVAKDFGSLSLTSKTTTPITDITSGASAWQVETNLVNQSSEIIFIDLVGNNWATFTLDNATKTFLSTMTISSTSPSSISMTISGHSGYRVCSSKVTPSNKYDRLDQVGRVFAFDFSDGYGRNASGFTLGHSGQNFFDNPLIDPNNVAYKGCTVMGGGSYYRPANMISGIR